MLIVRKVAGVMGEVEPYLCFGGFAIGIRQFAEEHFGIV